MKVIGSVGVVVSIGDTATATSLLPVSQSRVGGLIFNNSSAILYILLGAGTASATNFSVALAQGEYYNLPVVYKGEINGLWASDAGGSALVTEFV